MRRLQTRVRQPAFGAHGRKVIAFLCGWELVALMPGMPLPTVSSTVKRWPWVGGVLLALLGHHWYLERDPIGYHPN